MFSLIISLAIFLFLIKDYFKEALRIESILLILLTIILLDATQPIFMPKIEILDSGTIKAGYVNNYGTYGLREFTVDVTPPIISIACTSTYLGYNTINIYPDIYGVEPDPPRLNNGFVEFCPPIFDYNKKIKRFSITSYQPIDYDISDQNITNFYWASNISGRVRAASLLIANNMNFPVYFTNITIFITNKTLLDDTVKLMDYVTNDSKKTDCLLGNLTFSFSREESGEYYGQYQIMNDTIKIKYRVTVYTSANNYTIVYLHFHPYDCE